MHFLLVDDHPVTRFGARQLIEREWPMAAVREAETLAQGISLFNQQAADAVILDLELPDATGLESVSRMLRVARGHPILVMSQNLEAVYAPRLLALGAAGFLPKDQAVHELVTAIKRLLQGGRYVTPAMADQLVGLLGGAQPAVLPHERLTTQEFRVMQLMAAGHAPADIAQTMSLSVKTVGSYRARIFEKTGWRSNAELTKYCVQHGLTAPH
jgi:DNA-binding NarL/FixJ family response regulator